MDVIGPDDLADVLVSSSSRGTAHSIYRAGTGNLANQMKMYPSRQKVFIINLGQPLFWRYCHEMPRRCVRLVGTPTFHHVAIWSCGKMPIPNIAELDPRPFMSSKIFLSCGSFSAPLATSSPNKYHLTNCCISCFQCSCHTLEYDTIFAD